MGKYIIFNLMVIFACIGIIFLSGWFLSALWNWLAPLFWTAAPVLNIWHGIGIIAFFRFMVIVLSFKNVEKK